MKKEYNKFYDLMSSGKYGTIIKSEEGKNYTKPKKIYFLLDNPNNIGIDKLNGELEKMLEKSDYNEKWEKVLGKGSSLYSTKINFKAGAEFSIGGTIPPHPVLHIWKP